MVLYKSKQIDIKIGVLSKKISMTLSDREIKWTVNQNHGIVPLDTKPRLAYHDKKLPCAGMTLEASPCTGTM